jgi:hypothetical protein
VVWRGAVWCGVLGGALCGMAWHNRVRFRSSSGVAGRGSPQCGSAQRGSSVAVHGGMPRGQIGMREVLHVPHMGLVQALRSIVQHCATCIGDPLTVCFC